MIALATSNTLKLTDGEYTGVVKYRGNTDQYGYNWTDSSPDFYIQNRIPAAFQNQAFPVTESVYRQSNGYYRRAKTFVEKTKELHTDWETDQFHEGLVLALKHDVFYFENTQYFHEGSYDLENNEYDELKQATAILTTQEYNRTNQQCS